MSDRRQARQTHCAWLVSWLALALGVAPGVSAQQTETRITGHVQDASEHLPIPAAVVLVAGTTVGTNTSDSGTFTLARCRRTPRR